MRSIAIEREYTRLCADRQHNLLVLAQDAIRYVDPRFEQHKNAIAANMKKTAALVAEIDRQQLLLADQLPAEYICKVINQ